MFCKNYRVFLANIPVRILVTVVIFLLAHIKDVSAEKYPVVLYGVENNAFPIVIKDQVSAIVIDTTDAVVVKIAANSLAQDIERITGNGCVFRSERKIVNSAVFQNKICTCSLN